jgi:hypothetical protein
MEEREPEELPDDRHVEDDAVDNREHEERDEPLKQAQAETAKL